jgi:hypothetical protein
MPLKTFIEPNPNYKPKSPEDKAVYDAIVKLHKERGAIATDTGAIVEIVFNSGNMYREKVEAPPVTEATIKVPELNDLTVAVLKQMALLQGINVNHKQRMTKDELVRLLQSKLDAIDIVDDTEADE